MVRDRIGGVGVGAYIATIIVGGRAPFNIMRKDLVSKSRRVHSDDGCSVLVR